MLERWERLYEEFVSRDCSGYGVKREWEERVVLETMKMEQTVEYSATTFSYHNTQMLYRNLFPNLSKEDQKNAMRVEKVGNREREKMSKSEMSVMVMNLLLLRRIYSDSFLCLILFFHFYL